MVSMVSPGQGEHSDDLLVVDSPSLRGRMSESGFADNLLLPARPTFGKRGSRAFIRYLIACGVGVGGTLAWQSYGDAAKQTIATWGAGQGWSMAWLSTGELANANPSLPQTKQAVLATQASPGTPSAPASASSSDLEQLKTMTLGLAATLTTMRERIEQLAGGQAQTASDIAKLQAAEQEIRHKISAGVARPAAAALSKPTPPAPAHAPTPPR
jgi:hypothetical protein